MDTKQSRPYEPPRVIDLGSVAELTQALQSGSNIDFADFLMSV